jgi:CheY-like chemotaxis protein
VRGFSYALRRRHAGLLPESSATDATDPNPVRATSESGRQTLTLILRAQEQDLRMLSASASPPALDANPASPRSRRLASPTRPDRGADSCASRRRGRNLLPTAGWCVRLGAPHRPTLRPRPGVRHALCTPRIRPRGGRRPRHRVEHSPAPHAPRVPRGGASGGREALDAADPPDVALVDLGMPGVDGYEVARRLRAGHTARPPILIAVTALGHAWGGTPARAAEFHLYLTKPVPPAELVAVLRQCDQARRWGDARDERPAAGC